MGAIVTSICAIVAVLPDCTTVAGLLEEDFEGSIADENAGLGPAERIVVRSVEQLPDENSKLLFSMLGIVPGQFRLLCFMLFFNGDALLCYRGYTSASSYCFAHLAKWYL